MSFLRNLFARRRTGWVPQPNTSPLDWVRSVILLGLVWFLLWFLGLGWVYPWVVPFVRSPGPPPVMRDAEEVPLQGAPPAAAFAAPLAAADYGWAGPEAAKAARMQLAGQLPEYTYGADEWRAVVGRRVVLWPFRRTMHGRDPPNIAQEIGDCVSWGWTHGTETSMGVALFFKGGKFTRVFPPYIYGTSRVQVGGGRIGGDGSVGAWAAKAVEQYGVLPWPDDGSLKYSGGLARQWGSGSGPPRQYLDAAKPFKAKANLVTSFDAACVAISHGYAVPVCSSQGFRRIVKANGRVEGRPSGTWAHCMCFIGFDTRPGLEALYCENSWGPNAHAKEAVYAELDGAPPGGFWVDRETADRMLRAGDSYSVEFPGFSHTQDDVLRAFTIHAEPPPGRRYAGPTERGGCSVFSLWFGHGRRDVLALLDPNPY